MGRSYNMTGLAKHFKEANSAGRKSRRIGRSGGSWGASTALRNSRPHPKTLLNWFRWWIGIYLRDNDLATARRKALQASREMWLEQHDAFAARRRLGIIE